jgi:hypothetical protein
MGGIELKSVARPSRQIGGKSRPRQTVGGPVIQMGDMQLKSAARPPRQIGGRPRTRQTVGGLVTLTETDGRHSAQITKRRDGYPDRRCFGLSSSAMTFSLVARRGLWWADEHERTGGLQKGYGGFGRVCSHHADAIKSKIQKCTKKNIVANMEIIFRCEL